MPQFLDLPAEILTTICKLGASHGTEYLCNVASVNSLLNSIATPILYREVVFIRASEVKRRKEIFKGDPQICQSSKFLRFVRTVLTNQARAELVRSIQIEWFLYTNYVPLKPQDSYESDSSGEIVSKNTTSSVSHSDEVDSEENDAGENDAGENDAEEGSSEESIPEEYDEEDEFFAHPNMMPSDFKTTYLVPECPKNEGYATPNCPCEHCVPGLMSALKVKIHQVFGEDVRMLESLYTIGLRFDLFLSSTIAFLPRLKTLSFINIWRSDPWEEDEEEQPVRDKEILSIFLQHSLDQPSSFQSGFRSLENIFLEGDYAFDDEIGFKIADADIVSPLFNLPSIKKIQLGPFNFNESEILFETKNKSVKELDLLCRNDFNRESITKLLKAFTQLERFRIGGVWCTDPLTAADLEHALLCHRTTLRSISVNHHPYISGCYDQWQFQGKISPISFQKFNALESLALSFPFLFGYEDCIEGEDLDKIQDRIVKVLPKTIKHFTIFCNCQEHWGAWEPIKRALILVVESKEHDFPQLCNVNVGVEEWSRELNEFKDELGDCIQFALAKGIQMRISELAFCSDGGIVGDHSKGMNVNFPFDEVYRTCD